MLVAGDGDAVAQHAALVDVCVVADVRVGHDPAVRVDAGASLGGYAAVDYHVFAYHAVVADVAVCVLTFPAEVLRVGADDCALIHFGVLADAGALHDGGVWHDFAAVADLDVHVDEGEWMDGDVVAEFGGGVDVGKRADHIIAFLEVVRFWLLQN